MAFATADDVAERLKRSLSAAEQTAVEGVLDTLDGLIRDAIDKAADWTPDPVPAALKEISIQKAIGALANPGSVASESLGAHSVTYQRSQDGGIFLSDAEGRALRLAVHGTNSASSTPRSVIDRLRDLREGRDVDEPETE